MLDVRAGEDEDPQSTGRDFAPNKSLARRSEIRAQLLATLYPRFNSLVMFSLITHQKQEICGHNMRTIANCFESLIDVNDGWFGCLLQNGPASA